MALVSGRAISDLEKLLGTLRLPLAGQHGLERRDAAGRLWMHAAPPAAKCAIKEALAPVLARHPGLLLEDKGLTLALHYRLAPHLAAYAHAPDGRLAADAGAGLEVQRGKRVAEIKPAGIDKGTAVAEYLARAALQGTAPGVHRRRPQRRTRLRRGEQAGWHFDQGRQGRELRPLPPAATWPRSGAGWAMR